MTHVLRQLERDLLHETGKRLARLGFSSQPKGQTFMRPLNGGQVAVHLSFIEHEHDVDVTADVAVRFDSVENLVHQSNRLLSKEEKATTFTLGVELGSLQGGEPDRVTVTSSKDVAQAADYLAEKIEMVGMPYLEKYSHPEAAYEVLSRDDRSAWIHSPIHAERAKRACALLAVMRRHSEIPTVGGQKLSFLRSINDPGATGFSRFLTELQSE